jgi:hypothetical protein
MREQNVPTAVPFADANDDRAMLRREVLRLFKGSAIDKRHAQHEGQRQRGRRPGRAYGFREKYASQPHAGGLGWGVLGACRDASRGIVRQVNS